MNKFNIIFLDFRKNLNKLFIIIILCFVINLELKGQKTNSIESKTYCGISVGNENFIGLPRVGGMLTLPLKNTTYFKNTGKLNSFYFASADLSFFLLIVRCIAPSVSVGFNMHPFTVENSFTYAFVIDSQSALTRKWFTANPKIGIRISRLWFKTGLSFDLWHKDYHDNKLNSWMNVNGYHINFDLLYFIKN